MNELKSKEITTSNSMMNMIEKLAINKDVDADKLQKMLDMQLQIMDRQARDDYYKAMTTVHASLPSFEKIDRAHSNNYVKLERILEVLNPILRDNGFSMSFSQKDSSKDGIIKVEGIVSHVSGHTERYNAELEIDSKGAKSGPQKSGSTYSFARRYLTCMIFNINTYDDDDGNGGTLTLISKIEYDDLNQLMMSLEDVKVPVDIDKFCKHYGIENLEQMPKSKFNQAKMALQTKLKRAMGEKGDSDDG